MGNFTLNVSQVTGHAEKAAAGAATATTLANLLKESSPTLMEEWAVTSLYIPVVLYAASEAEIKTGWAVTVGIVVRYGGDIVFASDKEIPLEASAAKALQQREIIFSENLINPIIVQRGRTFTVEAFATPAVAVEGISIGISSDIVPGNSNAYTLRPGTVSYTSRALSGHRTL